MNDIFERATRLKLRFKSPLGGAGLTTEQLFDLPLQSTLSKPSLESVALDIHAELKSYTEVDFLGLRPQPRKVELELQLQVVKRVIEIKKEENALARKKSSDAETRQLILAALAKKKGESIDALSEEELLKRLETLGS